MKMGQREPLAVRPECLALDIRVLHSSRQSSILRWKQQWLLNAPYVAMIAIIAIIHHCNALHTSGLVDIDVNWETLLDRHDPVWTVSTTTHNTRQKCSPVHRYYNLDQHCGSSSTTAVNGPPTCQSIGAVACDTNDHTSCDDQYAIACETNPNCHSYGVSSKWHNKSIAQLSETADVADAIANPDWTLFIRNSSSPTHSVCINETVPPSVFTAWEDGPFIGSGLVGALFRFADSNASILRVDLGRTDIWDRRTNATPGWVEGAGDLFMKPRLPVGHLEIALPPNLTGSFNLSLRKAEINAELRWLDGSSLSISAFAPYQEPSTLVLQINSTGSMHGIDPTFVSEVSRSTRRNPPRGYKANPPPRIHITPIGVNVSTQSLLAGGDYAFAMLKNSIDAGKTVNYFMSIANNAPSSGSGDTATGSVTRIAATGFQALLDDHRKIWQELYPASFLSIAQKPNTGNLTTALEGFYWLQMSVYKLHSAMRPGGTALDLMGPWYQPSGWLYYWFDLNVQLQYWPLYTANRLNLAQTLTDYLMQNMVDLHKNAALYGNNTIGIGGACPYTLSCPLEYASVDGNGAGPMIGDGMWTINNLFQHAIREVNDTMLADIVFPLLRGATAMYLNITFIGPDGLYHLPPTDSPEYPEQIRGNDTNFDVALFQWGLQTLIDLATRFDRTSDPLVEMSATVLKRLTLGSFDSNGYMVNSNTPFSVSHRHFSHLFHIYPLHLLDLGNNSNRNLAAVSLDHWTGLTCGASKSCPNGFTFDGASSISTLLGRRDDSAGFLVSFLRSGKVHQSTMYSEGHSPCIESPLAAANSLQEMLVDSWGGRTRIFSGVPTSWPDVAFADFLCEGSFLITAKRTNGSTAFIQVRALAGGRTFVADTDMEGELVVLPISSSVKTFGNGTFIVYGMEIDDTVVITYPNITKSELKISVLTGNPEEYHYWGSSKY